MNLICVLTVDLPDSKGLICLMRVAMAGVSLDFDLGSDAEGSSVSIGAKVSPSRHMPSSRPPAAVSTDTVSVSTETESKNSEVNRSIQINKLQ